MKKSYALAAGALAVPAVALGITLVQATPAESDPGQSGTLNVVGEPYGRAVQILKAQGVKAVFGGQISSSGGNPGGDLPQAQCIVEQQRAARGGRAMSLMVNCTKPAGDDQGAGNAPKTIGGIPQVTLTPDAPLPAAPKPAG